MRLLKCMCGQYLLLPWIQLLKIDYRGKPVKKSQRFVSGKIQKATSNFILIVWKIYQFVRNWTEHSVQFAQGKYIEYFNSYDRISTNELISKSLFYYII